MATLSASERRQALISAMKEGAKVGVHCGSCVGTCCTYAANSMKIDEIQANDLKDWLKQRERWDESLFKKLADCIEEFRLDRSISNISIRRTYTCPFYTGETLGCSIAPEAKPYGCLAFNAREAGITKGGNCRSDLQALESVPGQTKGEKLPIPMALMALR